MSITTPSIPHLKSGPVAILGNGVSGQGAAALLRSQGAWVNIFDIRGGDRIKTEFTERDAVTHRLVIFSPGFKPDHPWLTRARGAGASLFGELDFASKFWPGALVAVTGTNGKSTLTQFLVHALQSAGSTAFAAGNVGFPLSRFFESPVSDHCTAVCEISSFQAEVLQLLRPQALLWTNFSEDHLDRHGSMEKYFAAKWHLIERLSRPRLFVGPSVAMWAEKLGYQLPSFAKVIDEGAWPRPSKGVFATPPQSQNYALARAYWEQERQDLSVLESAAESFELSAHRLAVTDEIDGVKFWNDSVATNFAAAEAAIATVPGPVFWIGGGRAKGAGLKPFSERIASQLDAAFLIGETGPELAALLEVRGVRVFRAETLECAIELAWQNRPAAGSILFSPGFASFDQFKNYSDRGDCFCRAVLSLKEGVAAPTVSKCAQPSIQSS